MAGSGLNGKVTDGCWEWDVVGDLAHQCQKKKRGGG